MIDEDATFKQFGYKSTDLKPQSGKKIVVVCDECGKMRVSSKCDYRGLCHSCATSNISEETRKKMSEATKGEKNHFYGKTHSEESIRKMSESHKGKIISEEHRKKLSKAGKGRILTDAHRKKIGKAQKGEKNHFYGKTFSEEHRKKLSKAGKGRVVSVETRNKLSETTLNMSEETRKKRSAAQQGIPYDEWEGFARDSLYCPKFNRACRESNREKYGRKCFICGKHESNNITKAGKQQRLSVHHVDMDKMQGCNGRRWRLIPTCIEHHNKVHSDLWMCRIIYLLENVYSI